MAATVARALLICGLAGRLAAASRAKGAGAGGRHFLKGGQDLQPEVVADLLTKVEDEWKSQAASFAACNGTLNSSCGASAEAFERSCSTVVGAVVKGSSGDRRIVAEYMGSVCSEPTLQGWKRKNCQGLKDTLATFMSADDYANREQMDARGLCRSLWQSFSKEELEERQAELARQEKEREEAEKKAAEEAKRRAEEEAKRQEEEAKRAAEEAKKKAEEEAKRQEEEAKRKVEEEKRKAEEEKRKAEEERRLEEEAVARQAAEAKRQAEEAAARVRAKREEAAEEAELAKEKMREAREAAEKIREYKSRPKNASASEASASNATNSTNTSVVATDSANTSSVAVSANTSFANVSNTSLERLTTVVGMVKSGNASAEINTTAK